jgi:hypothetical protein
MLKRNGEPCQYQVPGFAGRLTETEHGAYSEAVASVDDQLRQLNEAIVALSEMEKQLPDWTELAVNSSTQRGQTITVQGEKGAPWQVLRTLSKTAQNEVMICSRGDGSEKEFGVVEKVDPNSAYARAQGACHLLLTSNDPHLLMQEHIENEKTIHQLFRKEIEATVEESLSEKYQGQDMSRVVRAVGARCNKQTPVVLTNDRSHTITHNAKIRF